MKYFYLHMQISLDAQIGRWDSRHMAKGFTQAEVILRLRRFQGNRSQRETAEDLDIPQQFLSAVLLGKKNPSPKILERIGLESGYIETDSAA